MQKDKYVALSRKYRPITFDQVTGHDIAITILKNQLNSKHLAHAYLFTGLHGTGKTTLARIFAKSLNCERPVNGNPCNNCTSCNEITCSSSLDVLEIDGASNRGIDDIRNINESVGYATFQGKYKIYIIDEVHMLTKEAFNALLKTLEEPPANTKFFLATTEAHKIPPTILSRCQRIDLKRIETEQIKEKLISITKELDLKIEEDALSIIARLAEGSMRDGESLLENVIAYSDKTITANEIYKILGLPPKNVFFTLDNAFKKEDLNAPFTLAPELFSTHTNLTSLIDELSIHYKYVAKALLNVQSADFALFTKEEKEGYKNATAIYSISQVMEILNILANTYHYNFTPISKQIHVEMLLQKILSCKHAKSGQEILKHLQSLKGGLQETVAKPAQAAIYKAPVPPAQTAAASPAPAAQISSAKASPPKKADQNIDILSSEQTKKDTILQFAAVELGAKLNKNL
ncbi:MAG: Holliday junction ATP-dependent DNA helicase RuvB [Chlamydiia bacterium]|nr:Holliday junction ATP-dependent DNA helicase RuvB [Chlamydiia bacterium]MCH9619005.1 Holliday junction ATP-dependent DNA helicase RuvB [Chlamydiia bacterium]MCH9624638.1 Holliday junction ATP-dependent DNA helicase RuvB [Chlamydiia bacterium]